MTTEISADGKCQNADINLELKIRAWLDQEDLEPLEIIIDGNQLQSGSNCSTLLGQSSEHLPQSRWFRLTHFEALPDGRCRVRYSQRKAR